MRSLALLSTIGGKAVFMVCFKSIWNLLDKERVSHTAEYLCRAFQLQSPSARPISARLSGGILKLLQF